MAIDLKKWLWCSWRHRSDRCSFEVWKPGTGGRWHCARCHPCGEEVDRLMAWLASLNDSSKEIDGSDSQYRS